jgi:hypothetical protein
MNRKAQKHSYAGVFISKQPFSRVAFPEQLLFDTFSGATN